MIARGIGSVHAVSAGLLRVALPGAALGSGVVVTSEHRLVRGTITAVSGEGVTVTPHDAIAGVMPGDRVHSDPATFMLALGTGVLGRAFDARGIALDSGRPMRGRNASVRFGNPTLAQRIPVAAPLWTGIRAIDGLLTFGRGARVGVFGAPGAGKSILLRMLAEGAASDTVVVGLIGERGREAAEWTLRCNGRTSIVAAPTDHPTAERVQAAKVAVAQAHALRTQGLHVLLILDSLARFAMALRELAVANGEPSGRGGYPPSVFAEMAKLLEAGGNVARGSITIVATVLWDGDEREPLADAARSLLDGHIMLSNTLSDAGHYPAVDITASKSRTMQHVVSQDHAQAAKSVCAAIAHLNTTAELRSIGMSPRDGRTLCVEAAEPAILRFLQQHAFPTPAADTLQALRALGSMMQGE